MTRVRRLTAALVALVAVSACEERLNPTMGRTPVPPVTAPTGEYTLREVNGEPLPHTARQSATNYNLVSGSFNLIADSSWGFSAFETVTAANGDLIGSGPSNINGTWRVTDTTIALLPSRGLMRIKGDTLFWVGAPKHSWEDSLTFTLLRR